MEHALAWWIASSLLGALALPYVFVVFNRLPDRGLAFARPFGLLLTAYLLWMGAVVGLVPNGRGAALLAALAVGFGAIFIFKREQVPLLAFLRSERRTILAYEGVYLLAFMAWALIRAYNPQLDTTEKPMDLAMLNSTARSASLPPLDPWLSGFTVNYYYFGYLMMATLNHLAGTETAVGFNLALAFLFASAGVAVMGLVANLVALSRRDGPGVAVIDARALRYGVLAIVLLLVAGNLVGVLEMLRAHGFDARGFWEWVNLKKGGDAPGGGLALLGVPPGDQVYQSTTWYPTDNWWWWRATRVIDTIVNGQSADYTITEFPFFSFLLGDLHPHVMSLPFVLLALGVCLQAFLQPAAGLGEWLERRRLQLAASVLVFGSLGFINGWDLGPYLGLFFASLAVRAWLDHGWGNLSAWRAYLGLAFGLGLGAVLAYAAFYLPVGWQVVQARGAAAPANAGPPIAFWTGPATRPLDFVLFWFVAIVTCGGLLMAATRRFANSLTSFSVVLLAGAVLIWVAFEGWGLVSGTANPASNPFRLAARWWLAGPLLVAGALLLHRQPVAAALPPEAETAPAEEPERAPVLVAAGGIDEPGAPTVDERAVARPPVPPAPDERAAPPMPDAVRFVLGLVAAALTLLLLCELVFVRDVFANRMNTVFKLYYQAWTWLAVAGAFGAAFVAGGLRAPGRRMWTGAVGLVLALCLVYPLAAIPSKTEAFKGPATLDGLAYLGQSQPNELQALRWLANRPADGEVVLEATGNPYSFFGRASTASGIPSVLGWAGHEVQWRGSDAAFRERATDIDTIYNAGDKNAVQSLLDKYRVTYVYVGSLETGKYPGNALEGFRQAFPVAYQNQGVTIYRVRDPRNGS